MGRYDLPSTIGNAVVVEEHEETIVVEGVLGGVTQQVTVRRDWFDDHTPGDD